MARTNTDFKKAGILFGYRPLGTFGFGGNCYCFGRSKRALFKEAQTTDQKEFAINSRSNGLNRCRDIVYWLSTDDLEKAWISLLISRLRSAGEEGSTIVKHLHILGDNYYSSTMPPDEFATWLQGSIPYEPKPLFLFHAPRHLSESAVVLLSDSEIAAVVQEEPLIATAPNPQS